MPEGKATGSGMITLVVGSRLKAQQSCGVVWGGGCYVPAVGSVEARARRKAKLTFLTHVNGHRFVTRVAQAGGHEEVHRGLHKGLVYLAGRAILWFWVVWRGG